MKIFSKLSIFVLALAVFFVLPIIALAQDVTLTTTTLNLGSENQDASNPLDENGPEVAQDSGTLDFSCAASFTQQVKIKIASVSQTDKFNFNPGLSFSDIDAIEDSLENDQDLLVMEIPSADNIVDCSGAGDKRVSLTALIPSSLDRVDLNLNENPFQVATVTFQGVDPVSGAVIPGLENIGTLSLKMQAVNQLEIQDLDGTLEGRGKQSIDDGDTLDNGKPGDAFDLEVQVENNYADRTNLAIEDVDLELDCSDDEIDLDDESQDLGDISEDDDEFESFNGEIEDDAEDGTVSCTLKVIGRDENGALHGDKIDFKIEIERQSHEIRIDSVTANPSVIACGDNSITLTVDFTNVGRSDEDDVAIEIQTSKELAFTTRVTDLAELDEDDSDTQTFNIPIPAKLAAGVYALQVKTFYDNTKNSDTEVAQVENVCGIRAEEEEEEIIPTGESLSLDTETLTSSVGGTASVSISVTNRGATSDEFILSLEGADEFAEPTASKTIFLNPGQTSSIFMNLRSRPDAEEGRYSASIRLKNSAGQTIQTRTFTVDLSTEGKKGTGVDLPNIFGGDASRVFWIIIDIILVIVAIFFIRLIFTGRKRKERVEQTL